MNKRHRYAVNKLVRDRTVERLEKANCIVKYRIMDSKEYINELNKKLLEEAKEVIDATSTTELISELADILEVVHAIGAAHGVSLEDIEAKRRSAHDARGGFAAKIYSQYVELDESVPQWEHYKDKPTKYPELEIEEK